MDINLSRKTETGSGRRCEFKQTFHDQVSVETHCEQDDKTFREHRRSERRNTNNWHAHNQRTKRELRNIKRALAGKACEITLVEERLASAAVAAMWHHVLGRREAVRKVGTAGH